MVENYKLQIIVTLVDKIVPRRESKIIKYMETYGSEMCIYELLSETKINILDKLEGKIAELRINNKNVRVEK